MKRKRLIVLAVAIAAGCAVMVFAPEGFAQSQEILALKNALEARIIEKRQILDETRAMVRWLLLATVLIILLGGASAFVQIIEKRWVKPVTVALGILVALVTSIVDIMFTADYRTLRAAAVEFRQKIDDARLLVADIHFKDNQTAQARAIEIQKILAEISGMEKKFTLLTTGFDLLPVAYAQQASLPPWTNDPQGLADRGSSFQFVGRAEDADLAKARELSLQDAVGRAAGVLADQLKAGKLEQLPAPEADTIRDYVRRSATTAGTHFTQGPSGRFQYYTLIKLDKSFLAPEVLRFVLPKPVKVVDPVLLRWRHRALLGGEFERRVAVYVGDVQPNTAFRLLIYVPRPDALVMRDQRGLLPTASAIAESQSTLLNIHVDPKSRQVDFGHNQRTYRLKFEIVGNQQDRVVLEVLRVR